MRPVGGILLFVAISLIAACDPAMSIRQVPPANPGSGSDQLAIEIAPVKEFTSSTFYMAKARITNSSNSPVTITGCELIAREGSYQAKLGSGDSYPIELASGTGTLGCGFFELREPVRKVFESPAEVRIHYVIAGQGKVAKVTLEGSRFR